MEISFSELLRNLRENRGYTVNQLAAKTGVSSAHISRLENEVRSVPKPGTIQKLAKALGSYAELMTAAGHVSETPKIDLLDILEDKSTQLLAGTFPLTSEQRLNIARLLDKPNITPGTSPTIPILGNIKAGIPLLSEQNYIGTLDIPADMEGKVDFALNVRGDSMIGAGIHDGDIVINRQTEVAQNGQIVVALVNNNETTLKYFFQENGKAVLRAANPEYRDIELEPGDKVQGYVVKVLKDPPPVNAYREYIYFKDEHMQEWNKVIEMAVTSGIKPSLMQEFVETQITLAKRFAGK